MQITLTIDTKPIKLFAGRLRRSRVFVATSAVLLLGLSSYAYAISTTPAKVFVAGEPSSAADVNQNFSELYTAASTNETDIGTLTSDVTAVEASVADLASQTTNACTWTYGAVNATTGSLSCPANTFAMSGGCGGGSGGLTRSRPNGITSGTQPVENATGWSCFQATSGNLDIWVLCCPQ